MNRNNFIKKVKREENQTVQSVSMSKWRVYRINVVSGALSFGASRLRVIVYERAESNTP